MLEGRRSFLALCAVSHLRLHLVFWVDMIRTAFALDFVRGHDKGMLTSTPASSVLGSLNCAVLA